MSQFGTVLPSTSNQKYLSQNTVISHIGKTFYCSVLPAFSIKFFFRVDLKKNILPVTWFSFVYGEVSKYSRFMTFCLMFFILHL